MSLFKPDVTDIIFARVISVFIHCQMPMDSTHATIICVSPNAPGHVKHPLRNQPGSLVCATKQADQGCAGLVSNKIIHL